MGMIDISPSAKGLPDPHRVWQAERERLKLEFTSLDEEDITDEELDRQNGKFMARELPLIEKIREAPVTTIEDARCQIEAIDQHERMLGLMEDQDEQAAIRTGAVASIRRCIGLSAAPAVMQEPDPHYAWIEQYRTLDTEPAEELGDSVSAAILQDLDCQAKVAEGKSLLERIFLTAPTTVAGALAQIEFWHEMEMSEVMLANGEIIEGKWTGNLDLRAQEMALAFLEAHTR